MRIDNVVIHTANFGGYDMLRDIHITDALCMYYTDMTSMAVTLHQLGWSPVLCNRIGYDTVATESDYYKWRPFVLYPYARFVVWLDSNIVPAPATIAHKFVRLLGDKDIAMFGHPCRNCVHQEAAIVQVDPRLQKSCKRLHLVNDLMREIDDSGYLRGNGLHETNVVVMRNTQKMLDVTAEIWDLLLTRVDRDQLVVDYVLWKHSVDVVTIPQNARISPLVSYVEHL